ncbi:hypothetical protein VKT23_017081 [Stygiomarasmius scandens]|uniref:Uncharacterized protein n=1 Tax=Marasmiellus scandens TaxID=2682957 RepID=A0ABR1IVE2_9AGAR
MTPTKGRASGFIFSDRRILNAVEKLRARVWQPDKTDRLDWPFGVDLERIARTLRKAIRNKVVLPVKAREYMALSPAERDQKLAGWRNSVMRLYEESVVFVDEEGVSLVWYLPDLLSNELKNKIHQKTGLIHRKLVVGFVDQARIEDVEAGNTRGRKRRKISEHQFLDKKMKPTVFPGICWFSFTCQHKSDDKDQGLQIISSTGFEEPVEVIGQTEEWLAQISEHQLIVSLVLSFIHPGLYQGGRLSLEKCCQDKNQRTSEWAKRWNSVFTSITVVSGRTSVPHVETEGALNYFNALVGIGTAGNPSLNLRELNASFRYKPGCGVFFSGQGWTQELPDWGTGECLCYVSRVEPEMIEYGGEKVEEYGLKLPLH